MEDIIVTNENRPSNYVVFGLIFEDKERIERVANMQLYREKIQLRYHTVDEADAIWKKNSEKTAVNMLMKNKYIVEEIAEATELTVERVKELKEQLYKK